MDDGPKVVVAIGVLAGILALGVHEYAAKPARLAEDGGTLAAETVPLEWRGPGRAMLSKARDGGAVGELRRVRVFDCPACDAGLGVEAFDEAGYASGPLEVKP